MAQRITIRTKNHDKLFPRDFNPHKTIIQPGKQDPPIAFRKSMKLL